MIIIILITPYRTVKQIWKLRVEIKEGVGNITVENKSLVMLITDIMTNTAIIMIIWMNIQTKMMMMIIVQLIEMISKTKSNILAGIRHTIVIFTIIKMHATGRNATLYMT